MLSHILLNVYVQSTNRLKHDGLQNATVTKHNNLRLKNPVAGRTPIEDPGGKGRGVVIEVGVRQWIHPAPCSIFTVENCISWDRNCSLELRPYVSPAPRFLWPLWP